MAVPNYAKGLAGVTAGESAICTVGKGGHGLMYRGYSIDDLAHNCIFEEVAFLLVRGKLPNKKELNLFLQQLEGYRELDTGLRTILEHIPKEAHPMDVLQAAVSFLGTTHREEEKYDLETIHCLLTASFSSIICYHYHFHWNNKRIETRGAPRETTASHFLRLLQQRNPAPEQVKMMEVSLILYAEHGFCASTFNARVVASTLSDAYSCVSSAIGTLRGPLHGGANEAAMHLLNLYKSPKEAREGVLEKLSRKERVMGFGHRVYKTSDPRSDVIKECARELSKTAYGNPALFQKAEAIEKLMWDEKKLFPNLDFFSATAYNQCSIPTPLFTPIFVFTRASGWLAHVKEQRANNKLFRPLAFYTGPELKAFVSMESRL